MIAPRQDAELFLERERHRLYGKYRGIVEGVEPTTGRIAARVPAVLGDTVTGWCMPCVPYAGPSVGIAFLPEKGSGVWIEFEGGDVSYPVWVGCYWRQGEMPEGVTESKKVIATTSKTRLVIDDDQHSTLVEDSHGNSITMTSSGITLKRGEQTIMVSPTSVSIDDGALEVK